MSSPRREYNTAWKRKWRAEHREFANQKQREWWNSLPKQTKFEKAREYRLQRLYGMTSLDYDDVLEKQKFSCPVCLKHQDDFKEKFVVDHSHLPPYPVRGLLCRACNHWVVGKNNDPAKMRRAADYIEFSRTGFHAPVPNPNARRKNRRRRSRKRKVLKHHGRK